MSHNCFPVFHCVKNEDKHTALYTVGSIDSRCSGKWARTHPPEEGRIKDRTRETAEFEPIYTFNIKTKNQTINIFQIQNLTLRLIFNFCFSVEELINWSRSKW